MNETTLSLLYEKKKEAEDQLDELEGRAQEGAYKFIEALDQSLELLEAKFQEKIGRPSRALEEYERA